jgi:flavin-dependent dehydrogenase
MEKDEKGLAKGVTVRRGNKTDNLHCKLVVDAEGVPSKILRQAGLVSLNHSMLVNAVEAEVENVESVEIDMVEVFLGKNYASKLVRFHL